MKTGFLTRNIPAAFDRRWLPKALLASPFVFAAFGPPQASAAAIATGTVMVSTGSGKVTEFTQTGTMITQIDTGTGAGIFTTGSIFDNAGNFYVTDFNAQQVTKFDPTGFLIGPFGSGYNADPESIVLDAAGNFYVGQADGTHHILKFDPTGTTLLATFAPATEDRGTDWIELGADQCTLFYTSEGPDVLTFNACTATQGPNFNLLPLPGGFAFAHRLLPAGGMLVADTSEVTRLDTAGNQIQHYILPGISQLFALNLDPDGTSFWTADDGSSGLVFKVDIASGTILQQWSAAGAPGFAGAFGLSVKGEIIVSNPQTCLSTDAVLANETMPVTGTLDYGISSPTRTLSSITLVKSSNIGSFTLPTIAGGGHSATGGVFVKANPTLKATFELQTNFTGPTFACLIDPIITTLRIKSGHQAEQAFHMIAKSEHFIDVENGSPGLNALRIDVNGNVFTTRSLRSGELIRIDASAAMTLAKNTLTFIGEGKTGSFANIEVSDSAPKSSKTGKAKGIWGRLMYEK